jgi:hypothetical protein
MSSSCSEPTRFTICWFQKVSMLAADDRVWSTAYVPLYSP